MRSELSDYLTFDDQTLKSLWARRRVPISDVYEAYIEGRIDIPDEAWAELFKKRHDLVSFRLTSSHVRFGLTRYFPNVLIHSKRQDKEIVSDHYDRGNDFFGWFLGEAMVYTAGYFPRGDESLEVGQEQKIDHVGRKLRLSPEDRVLDIGCGWGTLVARFASEFGAKVQGVTLAKEQVEFGAERISAYGAEDRAQVRVCDYRDVEGRFSKIVSLEMVEHVGVKNLPTYFQKVHSLLEDQGLFLLSWTGIRNLEAPHSPLTPFKMEGEDLNWALFMNRHIFEGADASIRLSTMLKFAEDAGFEIADVENVSSHYVITLDLWFENWRRNRAEIVAAYGERWFRLWSFFLYWSARIGEQGSAFNYQVLLHKSSNKFDRKKLHAGYR